jgi:ATP-dependent Clp protease protease subunit
MWVRERPGGVKEEQLETSAFMLARVYRFLFFRGVVANAPNRWDQFSTTAVSDSILAMNRDDPTKPITVFIDSPGGDVNSGFILYDTIRMSRAPVKTVGQVGASAATILLAAGTERLVYPSARFMLHLPSMYFGEGVSEAVAVIRTAELTRVKEQLAKAYIDCGVTAGLPLADTTGLTPEQADVMHTGWRALVREKLLVDINLEHWMSAEDAIAYGLADRYITQDELFPLTEL